MQNKTNKPYKVEPSVIVFVFIILALLLGRTFGGIFPMPQIVGWLGLALSAAGLGLGLLALREFKRMRTFSKSKVASSNLVTTGIYGYTRNPVNLGFLLILIGLPFTGGSYWGIALMPMFIVAMNSLVIQPEETYLEIKFKDEFTKYKSRVRRWI
jgi:protein-S-isoprenylcysteine O-methyltransferase Ste14